jgi:predicted alpha/beta superfamily hydrolase
MKNLTSIILFLFSTLSGFPQIGNTLQDTIKPISLGYAINLNSIVLNEKRTIYIYLPDNYKKNEDPCPVLYLFDAETDFKPVCGVVDILTRWKIIPELIVVGLPNTDRMRDLTPTHDRKFNIGGGGDSFRKFLCEELIPYIDRNYNTQSFRILEGHSISGMFTMYAFTTDTKLFDAFIAVSPSMYWDEQIMLLRIENFLKSNPDLKKQLYITLSNEPAFMFVNETVEILRKEAPPGLIWKFKQDTTERHEIAPLRSTYEGLRFIFSKK